MIKLLTQADKEMILEYLERNEIDTSFLYANIVEFGIDNRKEIRRCGDYYGFFHKEMLRGILPFYNLGSCIPHYEVEEAILPFAKLMKERQFQHLIGMRKVIKPLYEEIKDHKEILSYEECSYFVNKDFTPFIVEDIRFIEANKDIVDEVVDFVLTARAKGFNDISTREDIKKSLLQRGDQEDFIIAQRDGEMIAQACIQTYTPQINQIGSVYTKEEERGKGYCKAIVSEICRRIIAKGKTPTLSVKKNNTPAIRAYTSLGFEHYEDYLIVKVQ